MLSKVGSLEEAAASLSQQLSAERTARRAAQASATQVRQPASQPPTHPPSQSAVVGSSLVYLVHRRWWCSWRSCCFWPASRHRHRVTTDPPRQTSACERRRRS